ncbi:phosphate metabolism protein 7, partial [Coemansia guatemalensis]
MFSVISVMSASAMLPVNIKGTMGATGLNALSIGNVDPKSNLLWVHVGVFALSIIWVLWSIVGELRIYTHLRMWWLTSGHASTASASTVLISDIPSSLMNDDKRIHTLFDSMFPGGVRQLFVNRSSKKLIDIVDRRNSLASKLEKLLTDYAVKCLKAWEQAERIGALYTPPARPMAMKGLRIPFLSSCRTDAFEYYASEILVCNRYISETAENMDLLERQPSALVMFNKQIAAHMAAQTVLDFQPFSMARVSTNVNPEDIIWSNLQISPWSRRIRGYISFIITVALIVLWTVLTAILSSLVQVNSLVELKAFHWLKVNSIVMGMFSGIVPSLVLAVLMNLLPTVLRLLLRVEGTTRRSEIDLRLLHRYYFFQIWNIYLVSIFSSSVFQIAVKSIGEPGKIVELIQTQVPQSATNILTYVLLLAFLGAAKEVLQGTRLALRYVLPLLLPNTPRNICRAETPAEFDWGTSIPTHSLIFVMGFSYSFIAPIVNWFVAVYFGLFYLIYRYQFLYVYNDTNWSTGGLSFPKSVKQML